MAATREMMSIAIRVKPDQVTLVPEKPNELTTTGGLDVVRQADLLKRAIAKLHKANIKASLFVDPDRLQVRKAHTIGAKVIEINTGAYADAVDGARSVELKRVKRAAAGAHRHGLEVLAGHGLTYMNVHQIAAILEIKELNIGHSIVSRAVLVGMERAVSEMRQLLNR
jgi:pyridoxine 5-phosphate synthase